MEWKQFAKNAKQFLLASAGDLIIMKQTTSVNNEIPWDNIWDYSYYRVSKVRMIRYRVKILKDTEEVVLFHNNRVELTVRNPAQNKF